MTTDQRLETESGAVRRLLAAAVGFVLALLGLTLATGPAAAQTRVGPQPVFSILSVGPHGTAGQETIGVRGPPHLQLVSATGVAAEGGSALADASSTAFKAADNAGDWTVSAKHLPGAAGRWAKFANGIDPRVAAQEALRSPDAAFFPNAGGSAGSFIVRTDLRYVVGSNGQTALRVVVSSDGQIITAFPVK